MLRVFCTETGEHGNELGVFVDGDSVALDERQAIARELGFSETVFVDDANRGGLRIFTPGVELPLAGHPLVGTAWLLREQGYEAEVLRPPAGEVSVRRAGPLTWISAPPDWAPEFEFVQLEGPAAVEALDGPPRPGDGSVGVWAWIDEEAGLVRERVFVPEFGIAEDEATGAAAMRLVARLGRELEIHQGRGSVIYASALADGRVEIGGRVVLDEVRAHERQLADDS